MLGASTGLLRKPAAPAASTRSCDEVWTSADTTIDPASGSSSRSLVEHVEPVHALHHEIEQDDIRLLDEIALEGAHAVLRLDDVVAGRLRESRAALRRARPESSTSRILVLHTRSRIASAIWSSGDARVAQPRFDDRSRHAVDDARLLGFGQDRAALRLDPGRALPAVGAHARSSRCRARGRR